MSAFITDLPVDVRGVTGLLPKDSYVESITWNALEEKVQIVWSNRRLVTPWSVPTPFSVQMLHDRSVPPGATIKEPFPAAPAVDPAATPPIVPEKKLKPVDRKRRLAEKAPEKEA